MPLARRCGQQAEAISLLADVLWVSLRSLAVSGPSEAQWSELALPGNGGWESGTRADLGLPEPAAPGTEHPAVLSGGPLLRLEPPHACCLEASNREGETSLKCGRETVVTELCAKF